MRLTFKKIIIAFCLAAAIPSPALAMRAALILEHDAPTTWTNLLRKGFNEATAKAAMEANIVIAPEDKDQTAIFRETAKNNDLVIVASDRLHEILRDNAANYRRVMFGSIDAGIRAPNIMSVTFADEKAAFLAGAYAAMLAKSASVSQPAIGWLSGEDTPAMRSLYNGYAEGALLAVPGCRVIQALTGSFTDKAAAVKKAQWLLGQGVSVITLATGAGNEAAHEVVKPGQIAVISVDAPVFPDGAGTISKAVDKAVAEIVNSAASGAFGGKQVIIYDIANKGTDFMAYEAYVKKHKNGEWIGRRISELRQELLKDAIHVPSLRQRTLCDCLD